MTGWDVLGKITNEFPPVVAVLLLIAAGVVFIVGFSRRGLNFIKYGFGKMALDETLEKRFDRLEERLDGMDTRIAALDTRIAGLDTRLDGMDTRIAAIETNHFGHLKDFLTELTSILLDKGVINNQDKARLDNKLRGM
ncbi:MAG: hypothetical protein LBU19_04855 [Treponema sp.]|jgi:hypothetical protein|nr:hypothetical protein [Treponema sp.]